MSAAEWVPAVNLVLGIIGASWLLLRTSRRWNEYPHEVRLLLALALALYFGLLSVSAEMLELDEVPIRAAAVISCVKVFSLFVLWRTWPTKYRTGTRTANGNPGADQNRDVR